MSEPVGKIEVVKKLVDVRVLDDEPLDLVVEEVIEEDEPLELDTEPKQHDYGVTHNPLGRQP